MAIYNGHLKAAAESFIIELFAAIPKALAGESTDPAAFGGQPVLFDGALRTAIDIVLDIHPHDEVMPMSGTVMNRQDSRDFSLGDEDDDPDD